MNEVKKPKKTMLMFYLITLAIVMAINMVLMPLLSGMRVKEIDYGSFMSMTEAGDIGRVQIVESENYILFTDKQGEQIYKTGIVSDLTLTERLHEAGAIFSGEIIEQPSIFSQIFFNWIFPIAAFVIIGNLISRHVMKKMGGQNSMMFNMGGRAAEEIAVGSVTTGASNDIEQATKLARAMITRFGMDEDLGMVAFETVANRYLGGDTSLSCSAETQTKIDERVVALIKKQYEKAKEILTQNRLKLDRLAQYLYTQETITGEQFMIILETKE